MMRLGFSVALVGALAAGVWYGAIWLRNDAQTDLLRQLQIQQAEREAEDVSEREARKKEIEDATPDELRARACAVGLLPAGTCATP